MIMRAPMDGVVGAIFHRDGESVQQGDTVLSVHAIEPTRIVGYLRQGFSETPKRGTSVMVRSRSRGRPQALAKIEEIGYRYEAITNQALMRPGVPHEFGMPIAISIPDSLRTKLVPGEIVELAMP